MNRIYKVIWSKVKHQYVVVSELAHSNGKQSRTAKRSLRSRIAALVVCGAIAAFGVYGALPVQQAFAADDKVQQATQTQYVAFKANRNSVEWRQGYQKIYSESDKILITFRPQTVTLSDGRELYYWVREGYTLEPQENVQYIPDRLMDTQWTDGIKPNFTMSAEITDPEKIKGSVLKTTESNSVGTKATTTRGESLETVEVGHYTGVSNSEGVETGYDWNYIIDPVGNGNQSQYIDIKAAIPEGKNNVWDSGYLKAVEQIGDNYYLADTNRTVKVDPDNIYIINNKAGVFVTTPNKDSYTEKDIYTGRVYGAHNEILMTSKDDNGQYYTYWAGKVNDDENVLLSDSNLTLGDYRDQIDTFYRNDGKLAAADIKSVELDSKNKSINLITNTKFDENGNPREGTEETIQGFTVSKTTSQTNGKGNAQIKFSQKDAEGNETSSFVVDAGSIVKANEETSASDETLTSLSVDGTNYKLSQGKTYTKGSGIIVDNTDNTISVDLAKDGDKNISGLHFNATGQLANNLKVTDYDNPTVTDNGTKINNDGGNWTITEADGEGLSRELTNTTLDTNASVDWNTGTDSLITGATIAGNASVTDAKTEYGRNYKVIDTDGNAVELNDVASASKLRDVADSANSAQTEAQKHTSVSADKNISVTKDTDPNEDGGANYKVSLKDNITLGEGNNQIQINGAPEGNEPAISVGQDTFTVGHDGSIQSTVAIDGMFTDTKDTFKFDKTGATFTKETTTSKDITKTSTNINGGTVTIRNDETGDNQTIISGKTITAGDIKFNGEENQATMTGLTNTTWDGTTNNESRAATEGQLSALDKFAVKYDKDKEDPTKPDYTSVSLGYKDEEGVQHNTQIHNVADGTEDNDAVNLSQLKDYQTTAVGDKNITVKNTVTDPNDPTKAYQVSLNPNLDVTSVTTGNSVMNTDGFTTGKDNMKTTINSGKIIVESDTGIYDKTIIDGDTVKVGTIEINSHKWQYGTINGLANVEWNGSTNTPNRAATEGQLQQATSDLSTEIGNLDNFAVKYDKDKEDPTKPDYTSVSLGYTDEDGVQHNTQIHNVADGVADNDAVNLSQLKDYQTTVAEGKNITVENTVTDPKDPTKAYQVSLKDDITLGNLEDNYVQLTGSKGTMQVANDSGFTNINGSTVTISSDTETGKSIVISDNGTDRTMSGLSNTTWSKDLAGQVAGSTELQSIVATQGQLQSAIQLADQDAKANDYRLVKAETDDGAYTVGDDGSVNLKVASENDKTGTTVTIKDIASAKDLDSLNDGAVKYWQNEDGSYDKSFIQLEGGEEGTKITHLQNGDVSKDSSDAINGSQLWETQQQIKEVETEAGKHTTLIDGKNTHVSGIDTENGKVYAVNLDNDITLKNDNSAIHLNGSDGTIIVGKNVLTGDAIVVDGNSMTAYGLSNTEWQNDAKWQEANVQADRAATEGQLQSAIKQAGESAAANDYRLVKAETEDGAYTVGEDGSVNLKVASENDKEGQTVTIKDVAKASELKDLSNLAVQYDSKDKTSVTLGGLTADGEVATDPVKLSNVADGTDKNDAVNLGQLKDYSTKATTTVTGSENIAVENTPNLNGSTNYTVSLKPDVTLDAKDKDGNSIELSGTDGTINAVNSTKLGNKIYNQTTTNEFNFNNGGSFVTEETTNVLDIPTNKVTHEAEFDKDGATFTKTEDGLVPLKPETSTTKIDGGTITISSNTRKDNNKIVIDGTDGEMSGLSNIAWDEETKKAVEADKNGTGAATIAATQGQLSDAIKEAGKDAAKNDFYLQNGTTTLKDKNGNQITVGGQNTGYKADADGNIDMIVANENGDKKHVVITDVASKEVLDKVKADVDTGWFAADSTTPADDKDGNFAVKPGDTVKFNGDDNITVTAKDNAVNVGLEDNILLGTENGQHIQFNGNPEDENANMISITDKTGNDVFIVKQDGTISSDNDVIADADGEKYRLSEIGDNTQHIEHYAADDEGNTEGKDYTQVEGTKLYNDGSISSTVEDSLGMSSDTLTFDESGLTVSKETTGSGSGSTNISGDTIKTVDEYGNETTIDGGSVTTEDLTVNAENDNKLTFDSTGLNVNSSDTNFNVNKDGISLSVDNGAGNNSSLKVTKDGTEFSYSENGVANATTTTIKGSTITTDTVTGLNNTTWDDELAKQVANSEELQGTAATQGQLQQAVSEVAEVANAGWTASDGTNSISIKPNETLNFVGDENLTVSADGTDKKLKVSLNDDITLGNPKADNTEGERSFTINTTNPEGYVPDSYKEENSSGAQFIKENGGFMLFATDTQGYGVFGVTAKGSAWAKDFKTYTTDIYGNNTQYSLNEVGDAVAQMSSYYNKENGKSYTVFSRYRNEAEKDNPFETVDDATRDIPLALRDDGAVLIGATIKGDDFTDNGIRINAETETTYDENGKEVTNNVATITGLENTTWTPPAPVATFANEGTETSRAATEAQLNDLYNTVAAYDVNADGTVNYNHITLAGTPYNYGLSRSTDGTPTGGTSITNVAYASGNDGSEAVNVDYLKDAIKDAVKDGPVSSNEKHLDTSKTYTPDKTTGKITIAEVDGTGQTTGNQLVINDVASKAELDSLKTNVGDLNYDKVTGDKLVNGDSVTTAIGKLDNKIDNISGTATDAANNTVTGGTIKDDGTISLTQKDGGTVALDGKLTDSGVVQDGTKFDGETGTLTITSQDKYNKGTSSVTVSGIASKNDIGTVKDTIGATSKEDLKDAYKDADKDGNATTEYITDSETMVDADVALDHAVQNVANTSYANDMILSNRIDNVENRLSEVEDRIDKVGAMAAAIANLRTMGYDPEAPTEVAVGIGQYKSETGLALGIFHYPNQDFMLSASISTSGDEVMGGIGATWRIGRKSAEEKAKDEEERILAKAEEIKQAAKRAEVKAQADRHAQLLAEREAAGQPIRPVEEA